MNKDPSPGSHPDIKVVLAIVLMVGSISYSLLQLWIAALSGGGWMGRPPSAEAIDASREAAVRAVAAGSLGPLLAWLLVRKMALLLLGGVVVALGSVVLLARAA